MADEGSDRSEASPAAVVDFIEGVQYPCSKAEILEHAAKAGAPKMVMEALQRLPDEQYYNLAHLIDRFSRVSP